MVNEESNEIKLIFFLINELDSYSERENYSKYLKEKIFPKENFSYEKNIKKLNFNINKKFLKENWKIENFKSILIEDFIKLNFTEIKKDIIFENFFEKMPINFKYNKNNNYLEVKYIHFDYWEKWTNIIKFIDKLKKIIELDIEIIDFEFKNEKYKLDLKNQEKIKKLFKDLDDELRKFKDKNSNKFNNLNLEINLLKKKINELSEERNLEEKLNLKKEIVESLINIFPYGSKAISAFKIIKNTVKLIDYKIEQEKIIDQ